MREDWLRYSCQMALPGFDERVQGLLQAARVLIIGAGGLGCPAAQYLTASGVGTIGIADYDVVSESNLHRQILYDQSDIGLSKASTACHRLQKQNPGIKLIAHQVKITSLNIIQLVNNYDIIVDCTDNFDARYLINDAGVITGKPVIYGAIYQFEGQVAVWNVANEDGTWSPNYRDVFPQVNAAQVPNCSVGGVIPTLAGIIGCIQANEVIKIITGTGDLLAGKLLTFDAYSMQSRVIKIGLTTKTIIKELNTTNEALTITADEARKGLASGNIVLVDVRTDQEHDEINIGGLHFELDEIADNLGEFSEGKTYVFYCSSGKRSAEAVKLMLDKAPNITALSLEGGLGKWKPGVKL
ncbi:ThiF family adenylyltransferase [Mucilaginibacter litoreus]|uniref:ThiF family adenylyltransferase n=1 Tax=Mucilaginibacter litoreus TaxID=1048221 RepID=A0ABW3ARS0_9SPHI